MARAYVVSKLRSDKRGPRPRRRAGRPAICLPQGKPTASEFLFTAVHRHEQVVQRFRQSWVRKGAIAQCRIRQLAHHCNLERRHNFATFDAEDRCAQDLVRFAIHDGLHETAGLVHLQGPCDRSHRQLRDANVPLLRASFRFGQANPAQLWIDKDRIGHLTIVSRGVLLFEEISADDTEIIVRNMRERRPALDVAECVDGASRSFEAVVYLDEAAIVRFNPSRRKAQGVRVRRSPCGDQQMRTGQSGRMAVLLDLQLNAPVNLSDMNRSCLQQDLNTVLLQDLANFSRDVGVLASQQLASRLNNRYTTAEAPKQLSKLQTNVATAQDQQVIGNNIEFHDGGVVQSRNIIQAIEPGTRGTGAGIDKDVFG